MEDIHINVMERDCITCFPLRHGIVFGKFVNKHFKKRNEEKEIFHINLLINFKKYPHLTSLKSYTTVNFNFREEFSFFL